MAKQAQLGDWADEIPDDLQQASEDYIKALRAKNKAQEKLNGAKERCIELMVEHGLERIRIDEGQKWLVCEDKHALKTEKIKAKEQEED